MATLTVPDDVPSADVDCAELKKAFDGWGTDEGKIISILGHRNALQREMIQLTYSEVYGKDLIAALRKELSGAFERAVLLWMPSPTERDVMLAHNATHKKASKHNYVLMEIACTRTSHELLLVRQAYLARHKRSLEEDVAHHLTGNDRKLLLPLLTAYRYEGDEVNITVAKSEADILHDKISRKHYYDDDIIGILSTRSKAQINATLNQYNDKFEVPINKDLKKDNEDISFLRAAMKCLTFPEKYYQKALWQAMAGMGTDEEALTRVVVTQAESSNMHRIMEEYHRAYHQPLHQAIRSDTRGDYEKFLLTLIDAA